MRFLSLFIFSTFLLINPSFAQDTVVSKIKLNSRYNDFAPAIYNDGLVFCSDRPSQFAVSWVDAEGNAPTKIYLAPNKDEKAANIFSENISSKMNEGPSCFSADGELFIYSATIATKDGKASGRLGLFFSKKTNDGWSAPQAWEQNSSDFTYSVTHPSITQDGNRIYFASDMPGGVGQRDIYYSDKMDGKWGKPINLGPQVNTNDNEVFPHITGDNKLYFSSDRGDGTTGLNLFLSNWGDGWSAPQKLDAPFNSDKDDFALVMNKDNTSGYFTSGRNGRNDDIFSFSINYPTFQGCQLAEQPMFCYYFEETNIVPNDSMPLIFEWEFGDGTKQRGITAEHCYKDFGTYHVALNVYDSLTKMHFAKISEIDVVIQKSLFPFITSVDSLSAAGEVLFSGAESDMDGFVPDQYFWDSGNGLRSKGIEASFNYLNEGFYDIQLGIIGKNELGEVQKRCATKRLKVGNPIDPDMDSIKESVLQEEMVFVNDQTLTPATDSTVYFVEFKQSEKQIPLSDDYFDNIKYEITERFDNLDTLYKYSVGETTDMATLVKVYNNIVESGYTESIVREESTAKFNTRTTNTWWYVPDSISASINRHLNKFNEILFESGTFTIKEQSLDNLNYISEVLNAEKSLLLKIKAHTDNVGNDANNLELSQKRADSVIDYLKIKGIAPERLEAIGYGESQPVADNETEDGRAKNRRVEFEIQFP